MSEYPETFEPLHIEDDKLILEVQALVDNELAEDRIPQVMELIQSNQRLRSEYIELLQLKRTLAGMPKLQLPTTWYESFEKRRTPNIWRYIGTAFFSIAGLAAVAGMSQDFIGQATPMWIPTTGLISMAAGIMSFVAHALTMRVREHNNDKSYKDVLR